MMVSRCGPGDIDSEEVAYHGGSMQQGKVHGIVLDAKKQWFHTTVPRAIKPIQNAASV